MKNAIITLVTLTILVILFIGSLFNNIEIIIGILMITGSFSFIFEAWIEKRVDKAKGKPIEHLY